MNWSLIVFLVIVAFFIYRGYRRGLLRSLTRIAGVIAGYACAIIYTEEATRVLEANSQLQGIIAFIAAGLGLFIGASIGVSLVVWMLQKLLGSGGEISPGSRAGGAAVGLVTGFLVAIVVVWAVAFVRDTRTDSLEQAEATKKPSQIETLANRFAGKAVSAAVSLSSATPEVARLTSALAESPGEIVQQAQRLAQSEDMTALLHDPQNQAVLDSGDLEAVRQLPAFQKLMSNPDLQSLAESTGLLDEAAQSGLDTEAALAQKITDIWGRTQRAKTDPRLQAILSDPAFRQDIQSGNPLDLLGNEKLLELANIIFAEQPAAESGARDGNSGAVKQTQKPQNRESKTDTKVYTWTDEKGQLHVSDVPPDQ